MIGIITSKINESGYSKRHLTEIHTFCNRKHISEQTYKAFREYYIDEFGRLYVYSDQGMTGGTVNFTVKTTEALVKERKVRVLSEIHDMVPNSDLQSRVP